MPRVFLSVVPTSEGGEAARFFEQERIPFTMLPFDNFFGWLTDLTTRSEKGDIAIAIFSDSQMLGRLIVDDREDAKSLSAGVPAQRVVLTRAKNLDPLVREELSGVAEAVRKFSDVATLHAALRRYTGHLASKPQPVTEAGIEQSGVADEASEIDLLGFEPYVGAVAEFLTHANTPAPLTMSIEGPWGSGKSSFMRQLEAKLTGFRTIRFNAWRHEKAEELWAAFALSFVKGIKPNGRWQRWRAEMRLAWKQFDMAGGWPDLVRVLAWFLALALATMTLTGIAFVLGPRGIAAFASRYASVSLPHLLESWLGPTLGASGWLVAVGGLVTLWQKFFARLKNPLEIDLRKYLRRPDYASKLAFLEHFQQDLRDATNLYLGDGKKVFVFIDDLDRCELPQAAELMRAINLMLSESGPIVFIIGMDREKIAAALAVKYEKLLPYLGAETVRGDAGDALQGILFGYEFLEKFIQIPFAVPEPTLCNIENLIASMRTSRGPTLYSASDTAATPSAQFSAGAAARSAAPPRLHEFIKSVEVETPQVARLIGVVAPALGNNPRRIKQYINLFRLRVRIAFATDLFAAPEDTPVENRVTLEKLAKFTAIELRWPLLLAHIDAEPDLLTKLETLALRGGKAASRRAEYWSTKPELMVLLRSGFDATGTPIENAEGQWSLASVDVTKLTRVSVRQPRRDPLAATPQPEQFSAYFPAMPVMELERDLGSDVPPTAPEPVPKASEWRDPETKWREQMDEERYAGLSTGAFGGSEGRDYGAGDGPGIDLPNFITGKHADEEDEFPPSA